MANLLTGLGIDEVLVRTESTGALTFLTDILGSTIALADSTGTIQTQYSYEPFGRTLRTGASSSNGFKFTGREDDATKMYYFRARYYHPELHRFIVQDPLGFAGGDVNLYAYVGNSPVNLIDPVGLYVGWFPSPSAIGNWLFGTGGNHDASGNLTEGTPNEAGAIAPNPFADPIDWAAGAGASKICRAGASAAGSGLGHPYSYHSRIRAGGLRDPQGHNFPYSFDQEILRATPTVQADGSLLHRLGGSINRKSGTYEIAVNPNTGVIFHRSFVGSK